MSDIECDVLIVGSGVGGLTAAIAARLGGLRALVVEKRHLVGGTSALSDGVLWLPNNPLMVRERVHDSRDAALSYLGNFVGDGDPASSPARRAAFVDGVAPTVALLEAQGIPLRRYEAHGDNYDTLPGGSIESRAVETRLFDANQLGPWRRRIHPQRLPLPISASELAEIERQRGTWAGRSRTMTGLVRKARGHISGRMLMSAGAALQGRLLLAALERGADVQTNAALVELLHNRERVTGALVDFDGWKRRVNAHYGVLAAAGGFSHAGALRALHQDPAVDPARTRAAEGDTGEAIRAMADAGAALSRLDEAWWTMEPPSLDAASLAGIESALAAPHVILVDRAGRRFVNEAAPATEIGRACLDRNHLVPAVPAFAVLDARHRRRHALPGIIHKDLALDGLARKCGIDPGGLEATVTRWNTMAMRGRDDDFGKGHSAFDRSRGDPAAGLNPCMGTIERGPFHAITLSPGDLGTSGGAHTDEHARVKRADGSPIEGLYAVGSCAAPLAGGHEVATGQSLGTAAVFAMIAIRHLVR